MPRIVSVKDGCFLQGLLQPEAFQGLAGSGLPHERDGMDADGAGWSWTRDAQEPVSYTHLTLPTIYSV